MFNGLSLHVRIASDPEDWENSLINPSSFSPIMTPLFPRAILLNSVLLYYTCLIFVGVFVPLHTSWLFSFLNNIFPYVSLTFWTFHYWEIFGGLGCFCFLAFCSGPFPFITSFYSSSPFFYLTSFVYFSHVLPTSSFIALIFCSHTQPR